MNDILDSLLNVEEKSNSVNNEIKGGEIAPKFRFNYTVALFGDKTEELDLEENRPFCAAALIAPSWVLTSAHCDYYSPTHAVIGRYNFDDWSEFHSSLSEKIEVKRKLIHPFYHNATFRHDYDFMLLELEKDSRYQPIRIDDGSFSLGMKFRTDISTVGWGKEGFFRDTQQPGTQPSTLHYVEMDFIPNFQCQLSYIYPIFAAITPRMICGRRRGSSVCLGDSGGPLFVKGDTAETDILIGITSFNAYCMSWWNSVFARVGSVIDWILDHVEDVRIYNENIG